MKKNKIVIMLLLFTIFLPVFSISVHANENEYAEIVLQEDATTALSTDESNIIKPELQSLKSVKNGVLLTWKTVNEAAKYRVYRKAPNNKGWNKIYDTASTSMINISVESGITYKYCVRCLDENGNLIGVKSEEKEIMFVVRPQISSLKNTKTGVSIKWTSVPGASKYRVYRKTEGQNKWNKIYDTASTSMINIKVESGKEYRYSVCCLDSTGNVLNSKSEEKSIFYIARPEITNIENAKNGISISWKPVNGAAKYRVYRKAPGDTSWKKVTDTTKNSAVNVKVDPGKNYFYSIRCIDNNGVLRNTYSESKSLIRKVTAYTNVPHSRLHIEKNTESDSFLLPYMTEVELLEEYPGSNNGNWLRIEYQGNEYYAWQYAGKDMLTAEKRAFTYKTNTHYQQEVVDLALSYIGKPSRYQLGALGEKDAEGDVLFDCSGFATTVLGQVMRTYNPAFYVTTNVNDLYEVSTLFNKNYPGECNAITVIPEGGGLDISLLQPGDLIFFNQAHEEGRVVDHVGLYLGDEEFIQATKVYNDLEQTVCVMPLRDSYADDFVGAIRILPEEITAAMTEVYGAYDNTKIYTTKDCIDSVDSIEADEPLTLLFTSNKFAYVQHGDVQGFVLLDRIKNERQMTEENRYVNKLNGIKLYVARSTDVDYIEVPFGTELTYNGRYQSFDNIDNPSNFYKVTYDGNRYYAYTTGGIDSILSAEMPDYINETRYVLKPSMRLFTQDLTSGDYITVRYGTELLYKGVYRETHEDPVGRFYLVNYDSQDYYIYSKDSLDTFLSDQAPEQINEIRYVSGTSIRLYSQDSTTSDSVTILLGSDLMYRGLYRETHEDPVGRFYLVNYDNQDYYVYTKDDIDQLLASDYNTAMSVKRIASIQKSVWLRSTMDTTTDENKLEKLNVGDMVEVIAVSSSTTWTAVKYENGYAFVLTSYLDE